MNPYEAYARLSPEDQVAVIARLRSQIRQDFEDADFGDVDPVEPARRRGSGISVGAPYCALLEPRAGREVPAGC
jgi:hypothetical protein